MQQMKKVLIITRKPQTLPTQTELRCDHTISVVQNTNYPRSKQQDIH